MADYDASNQILHEPAPYHDSDAGKMPANFREGPRLHARNVYAIVMRTLARFGAEPFGRRVGWSFLGHQLTVAPHAFLDLNAFYSKDDHAIYFGYYPGRRGNVFTCLSHEVIAHETTHALVDGLRPNYMYPSSPDQAAFHEGFADIVALLFVLSLREVVTAALDLYTSKNQKLIRASVSHRSGIEEGRFVRIGATSGRRDVRDAWSRAAAFNRAETGSQAGPERGVSGGAPARRIAGRGDSRRVPQDLENPDRSLRRTTARGQVSRVGVVDGAVETADHLLTIAIRALDYCPPTDLLFGDFLSAMLTADYELYPDDSRYGYREALRQGFRAFGFKPGSETVEPPPEPGLWAGPGNDPPLIYSRTHTESMERDPDEVFRFLWENRKALGVDEMAYTKVDAVRPCFRIADDGFFLRETVAVYSQQLNLAARELRQIGVKKPLDMPDDLQLTLYGGGALIFDESGRLKYHVRNRLRTATRQNPRLRYLWAKGSLNGRMSFAALHLPSPPARSGGFCRISITRRTTIMPAQPTKTTVRMYNVGFGDCFLLTFHYDAPLTDQHILIDFGAIAGKPDMKGIARDIKEACGGKLYAVVATHRHKDHISGFSDAGGKKAPARLSRRASPKSCFSRGPKIPPPRPTAR